MEWIKTLLPRHLFGKNNYSTLTRLLSLKIVLPDKISNWLQFSFPFTIYSQVLSQCQCLAYWFFHHIGKPTAGTKPRLRIWEDTTEVKNYMKPYENSKSWLSLMPIFRVDVRTRPRLRILGQSKKSEKYKDRTNISTSWVDLMPNFCGTQKLDQGWESGSA